MLLHLGECQRKVCVFVNKDTISGLQHIQYLNTSSSDRLLRACLYERRDGTFTGTGRLPGVPTCICCYSFYRILFIWRRDVFRPVSSSRDPGFSNRDPGLSGSIFAM